MLSKTFTVIAVTFLAAFARLSIAGEDEVIDLQELLRGVSSMMADVKNVITSCESAIKSVSSFKPRDCAEVWDSGIRTSGVHRVWPQSWGSVGSIEVYCDMTTDGGGWTVFQKRGDFGNPQDYFFKTWVEYKNGFGELEKEFWLGNDKIFALTNQDSYQLRVDLWDMEGNTVYAKYDRFRMENEDQQYRLSLYGYSGNAGDNMPIGIPFSTKDRDNDIHGGNCAVQFKGAWWYTNCHVSNLNGLNLRGAHASHADGIEWNSFKGHYYSLGRSEMKFRPTDFQKAAAV